MKKKTENKWFEKYPIDSSLGTDYFVHFSAISNPPIKTKRDLIFSTAAEIAILKAVSNPSDFELRYIALLEELFNKYIDECPAELTEEINEWLEGKRNEFNGFTQTESAMVLQDKPKIYPDVEASSRPFFKSIKANPIDYSTPVEKQPNGFIKI